MKLIKVIAGALGTVLTIAVAPPGARANGGPQPGAVTPNTVSVPYGPGSIRGLADEAMVDLFSGQVGYEVAFEVPAAHGAAPKLGLSYAGSLGNGPVGIGWTLRTPRIERSTRLGAPAFDDTDELLLVGTNAAGVLLPAADGTLRLEAAPMDVRVRPGGDGDGFFMQDSDGTSYWFGTNAAAQRGGGAGVQAWMLERSRSLTGAEVHYDYSVIDGDLYLASVTWGPGGVYSVVYDYGTRPDPTVSYREGFRRDTTQRLERVGVRAFGEEVRAYELRYDDSFVLSRLVGVTQTGRGGAGALPPLSFGYESLALGGSPQRIESAGTWRIGHRGVSLADVDGDGAADLIRIDGDHHEMRKSYGSHFGDVEALVGPSGIDLSAARLADLDGDSVADLVYRAAGQWYVQRFAGDGWQAVGSWPGTASTPLFGGDTVWVDIDGDHRVDLVDANADGLLIRRGLRDRLDSVQSPQPPLIGGALGPNDVRFADFNGDGLTDAIDVLRSYARVYHGLGNGRFADGQVVDLPWADGEVPASEVHLADLNRDGLSDLVTTAGTFVRWYRGEFIEVEPGKFVRGFAPNPVEIGTPVSGQGDLYIADINGNGSSDLVWSDGGGIYATDLAGPTTAGMLVSIDNGMGKVLEFDYSTSALLATAAFAEGSPWRRLLPMAIPVPVERRTFVAGTALPDPEADPGDTGGSPTPPRTVAYSVRDGFWDAEEQRFGGFLVGIERRVLDGATDRITTKRYIPGEGTTRALRGKPSSVTVETGTGERLTRTLTSWRALAVDGVGEAPRLGKPVVTRQRVYHYQGTSARPRTDVRYDYDTLGRRVAEHHQGRADIGGDEIEREWRYAANDDTWVRARVCEETVRDGDGILVSRVRTRYDGDADGPLGDCEVDRGWPRVVSAALGDGDPTTWIERERYEYDDVGNRVEITAEGVTRALVYDARKLFVLEETVTPDDDGPLTWRATWDDALGALATQTGPDGVVTTLTYDSLGRLATVARGAADATPHRVHTYRWTGLHPETRMYVYDGAPDAISPFGGQWSPSSPWRETVVVADGAGETRFSATRLDAATWIVEDYVERDGRGRVAFAGDPAYADALPTAARPEGMVGQTIAYDALDRMTEIELADGVKRTRSYAAFEHTTVLEGLAPELRRFDGHGRIVRSERTVEGVTEAMDGSYDAAGRLRTISLQDGAVVHSFRYDTLGRLVHAHDPDIGERSYGYDDSRGGALLTSVTNGEGQTLTYTYDGAGRLTSAVEGDGGRYDFVYDTPTGDETFTASRLAAIVEPTGRVDLGYDAFGRAASFRRAVGDSNYRESMTYAPSGLLLSTDYHDGVAVPREYDAAGRLTSLGEWWTAAARDASGRIEAESFGNGVQQSFERDARGHTTRVHVARGEESLYDVAATYEPFGALRTVTDNDGAGLDHTAVFGYDGGSRLVSATIGGESPEDEGAHHFGFAYDGLQNVTRRTYDGDATIDVAAGDYVYGDGIAAGPRQLVAIRPSASAPEPSQVFAFDAAGRQIRSGDRSLTYNAFDQLVRVELPGGEAVEHAYGYDGQRVQTRDAAGAVTRWLSPSTVEQGGIREHYLRDGDRLIAKISVLGQAAPAAGDTAVGWLAFAVGGGALGLALAWLLVGASAPRSRPRWQVATASMAVLALSTAGCGVGGLASQERALTAVTEATYYHATLAAGPSLITRDDGSILAERRFEPFGVAIDSAGTTPSGEPTAGAVDFRRDPHNILNKRTDPDTGYSYHGARWLAPGTTRWLTPDPPVKAPDPRYLAEPWGLHPYQYVRNNPTQFWDPDGRDGVEVKAGGVEGGVKVAKAKVGDTGSAGVTVNTDGVKADFKGTLGEGRKQWGNAGLGFFMQANGPSAGLEAGVTRSEGLLFDLGADLGEIQVGVNVLGLSIDVRARVGFKLPGAKNGKLVVDAGPVGVGVGLADGITEWLDSVQSARPGETSFGDVREFEAGGSQYACDRGSGECHVRSPSGSSVRVKE